MESHPEASASRRRKLDRHQNNEDVPMSASRHFIPQIREWIDACNSLHGDKCIAKPTSQRQPEDMPLWLIDTHQQCIVPGTSADRYLALSYVWPQPRELSKPKSVTSLEEMEARLAEEALPNEQTPHSLLLDASNLAELQTPQALSSTDVKSRLPGAIRHALEITAAMGERYLWVDRLCILQNDKDTLSEVAKMDRVYSGAYLTIIAAAPAWMYEEKDSAMEWTIFESVRENEPYSPILGSSDGEEDFVWKPVHPLEMSEEEMKSVMNCRYQALSNSRWATRGWTYQEQILCKRATVFTEQGIFWDCQCCMWDGIDLVPGQKLSNAPLRADMGRRFETRWWPDFGFYTDLICPYNGREFSYPQDGLFGILGVLNALKKSFPGGFLWGMPRLFLDHALLWQPFGIAERRANLIKSTGTHVEPSVDSDVANFPTWAWCGWQCFVDPWSLRSGLAYVDDREYFERSGSWRTRNLVDWRILTSPSQSDELREVTEFDFHVMRGSSPDIQLPDGWTYHEEPTTGQPYFVHKEDESTRFRHPIPLKDRSSKLPYSSAPTYLMANLKATSFIPATVLDLDCKRSWFGEEIKAAAKVSAFEEQIFSIGPKKACPILVLQQSNGAFAGLLRLMREERLAPNESLQLVAISTGSANAADLASSLEWKVFWRGQMHYRRGNKLRDSYFEPQWLTDSGKRALLYNLDMAFDRNATGSAAMEQKLSEILVQVESRLQLKKEAYLKDQAYWKEHAPAYLEENRPIPLERLWFEARTEILRKQSKKQSYCTTSSKDSVCEFYNVLWVEQKDGISYRRACGWVPKHIWEAHATGPIQVKLG